MVCLAKIGPPIPYVTVVREAMRGRPGAFEDLYGMFSEMVTAAAYKIVRDSDDANDISQETWLLAFIKIKAIREPSSFPAWLHRVAVSQALQTMRGNDRRSNRGRVARTDSLLECEILESLDVARAINTLPPRMRLLVEFVISGHTLRSAAVELGIAEGTAKSQAHKARLRLKYVLDEATH